MELAKWTFPIISLCREPYEAKVSRTGLTGGMGRRTVRQRALCLPSQAVYRGKEESKKPNGEGKQVSQRKGRRGTRDAKSRNDPERIERETGEPDDAKVSCPVRGGLGEKAVRTSLVAYPTVTPASMPRKAIPPTSHCVNAVNGRTACWWRRCSRC